MSIILNVVETDLVQVGPFASVSMVATPLLAATASDYLLLHLGGRHLHVVSLETVSDGQTSFCDSFYNSFGLCRYLSRKDAAYHFNISTFGLYVAQCQ